MYLLILLLLVLAAGAFLAGVTQFLSVSAGRRQVVQAVMGDDYYAGGAGSTGPTVSSGRPPWASAGTRDGAGRS